MSNKKFELPILPLRDPELIVFPGLFCEVDVGRPVSLNAVNIAAKDYNNLVVMGMQVDSSVSDPEAKDFHGICTEAEIKTILPLDANNTRIRVILKGTRRGILKSVGTKENDGNKFLYGKVEFIEEQQKEIKENVHDLIKQLREMVAEHLQFITIEDNTAIADTLALSKFIDNIAGQLPIPGSRRLHILRLKDPVTRLKEVMSEVADIASHAQLELESESAEETDDAGQATVSEVKKLQKKIDDAGMPPHALKVAKGELKRLTMMAPSSAEFSLTYNYLDRLVSMPWSKMTEDKLNITEAQASLNADHYGLEKPKERILEFLSVRKLMPSGKGAILCLVGPPGVGKTSLGRSIAKAMGREFVRMSLGGVNDEAEIRGHRRTYIGAIPGRIMHNIQKAGSRNPVFMLDEIDKLCSNYRGDPESALLEILDPEQNNAFVDHYMEVPFDLSQVFFIATANESHPIKPALLDRMEVIELPGYSPHDKVNIARDHLIVKKKEENGLKDLDVDISNEGVTRIVEEYTSEAGVRSLERECGAIMRKVAVLVASEKEYPNVIEADMIPKYLGPPKIFAEKAVENPEVGLSAGLAWSRNGGSLLFVETSLTPGKGEIELTGNLGSVIKESATAARTWIKANAKKLNVDLESLNKYNIHIHFPAGATPKEGPSAGIAIAASMLSSIINKPIRNDVAMTGEITLRGRVLPIGGLKEKILAAHRAGIKEVLYPEHNKHDIEDIPADVRDALILTPVSNLYQALNILIKDSAIEESPNDITPGSGDCLMNRGTP